MLERFFGFLLIACCLCGCTSKPENNAQTQSNAMKPRSKPTRPVQNNLPVAQAQQISSQYAVNRPNFDDSSRMLNNQQNEIPAVSSPQYTENLQPELNEPRVQIPNSNLRRRQQNNQDEVIIKVEEQPQLFIEKATLIPRRDWRENGKISYVGEMEISMTGSRPIYNIKGYLLLDGEEVGIGFLYGRAKSSSLHREQEDMLAQDKHITIEFYSGSAFPETSRPVAIAIVGGYPDPSDYRQSIKVFARKEFLPEKVYNNRP